MILKPETIEMIEAARKTSPKKNPGKSAPHKPEKTFRLREQETGSNFPRKPEETFRQNIPIEHTDFYSVLRTDAAAVAASPEPAPIEIDLDLASASDGIDLISPSQESRPGETPQARLWRKGLPLLTMSGVPDRQARSVIGQWLKQSNGDAIRILQTLEEASEKQIFEFVPWVTATLKKGVPARPAWSSHQDRQVQRTADALAILDSLSGGALCELSASPHSGSSRRCLRLRRRGS
jgi:hypothetical protein